MQREPYMDRILRRFSVALIVSMGGVALTLASFAGCSNDPTSASPDHVEHVGDADGSVGDPGDDGPSAPDGSKPVKPYALLFGGATIDAPWRHGDGELLSDTWIWDGSAWSVRAVPGPPARASAALTPLHGKAILFGGWTRSSDWLDDSWLWNGTQWAALPSDVRPPPWDPTMASLGDEAILFLGDMTNALAQTWSFDGNEWKKLDVTNPPPREQPALARLGNELVLFGGNTYDSQTFGNRCLQDTWIWTGKEWKLVEDKDPIPAPCLHTRPAMAEVGGKLVRRDESRSYVWSGSTWTELPEPKAAPQGWGAAGTTFDGRFVLFGGGGSDFNASPGLADTWSFDGSTWTNLRVAGPPLRANGALTFVDPSDR